MLGALALMLASSQLLGAQRVTRNIPYRSHPSAEQYMDLYEPSPAHGGKTLPVVLFIHGGSLEEAGERRTSPMYAPVCPGLATRGILCVTMDYRLSPTHQWPAESERFFPSILEEGARLVRLMRELERPADLRILAGRRHVTTTTGFADPNDAVANLVAEFVRDPKTVAATP